MMSSSNSIIIVVICSRSIRVISIKLCCVLSCRGLFGAGRQVTPLHFDEQENLLFVVRGFKDLVLQTIIYEGD